MKTKTLIIAASLAFLAPLAAVAERGPYVSGSVGSAQLSDDFDGFDIDADSTAWRVALGYRFNDFFALEGGYKNFGRFEETVDFLGVPANASLKADGFTLGGVASIPLTDRFDVFGRAGAFFWDGDADINGITSASPDDTNLYLGGGLRFGLTERFSITTDYSWYDFEDTDSDVFSVGFDLRF